VVEVSLRIGKEASQGMVAYEATGFRRFQVPRKSSSVVHSI